jgi:TMEM175 potassium channel family protein
LTLLVLDLHAPTAANANQLLDSLRQLAPQFVSFVVSFAVVGVFWYGHHMELHFVVRSDRVHLWITLFFLLTISFVPFSASLLGKNQHLPLAASLYGANLCLAGVARLIHWTYATAGRRLVDSNIDTGLVRHVRRVFILVPVLYVAAAGLAWMSPIAAMLSFAVIPLLYVKSAPQTRHLTSLPRRTRHK